MLLGIFLTDKQTWACYIQKGFDSFVTSPVIKENVIKENITGNDSGWYKRI